MIKALIGKKIGMTQLFNEEGMIVPVTVIKAGPCTVVAKKNKQTDGYNAIQLGFEEVKSYRVKKPVLGKFTKNNISPLKVLKEFRDSDVDALNIGDTIDVSVFNEAKSVSISGITKGKGYQGVVKRWGFSGGRDTHGSMFHRAPGSIGQSSFPSKVFKGLKMPGHMGNDKCSVLNLKVIKIDAAENLLYVKGSVPGAGNGILYIYAADESGRKLNK
ncbi:MAG: 50S ribosomal protein L3 [Candidatus Acidulodesulfobacterium ferriphilum]|uniref:Large ribosomal subunit protein uL3 n=1 Tax=Candidatus Acidulodesulfobacterium ferriphilum TaxID=2597223 RepID=A0A519BD24_9DELT|nr:MAG: 50S ribosomal protein L3 [Candidatus Acidulodesulfobacterium ferriphilum]